MKKKLVFVIESLHLGGAEKSLVTLLQNLDYSLYEVDLIIFNKEGIFKSSVPKEVTFIYKSMQPLDFIERVRFKIRKQLNFKKQHSAQVLWKIINTRFEKIPKKYDVATAYNQGFATYYVDSYISSKLKFAWLNIDYQKAGYNINFDYPIYKNFNAVVAVSPEAKEGILSVLNKINKKLQIEIIKDISDKSFIIKQSQELNPFIFDVKKINIVTAGRLAKQKGLHLAIESCKILLDKGYQIHWYFVGEGGERKYLENLIASSKLEDCITFVGMTVNPYPYMKAADIYVQTSLFEGLGLTVIEASYLNKPIVCTNFPTVYGILEHEKTGLIAEMSAIDIANNIERLILDKNLKKLLIKNLTNKENNDKEISLQKVNELFNI
jgi:glycosyltransferase involved in cell wall biosynthesis